MMRMFSHSNFIVFTFQASDVANQLLNISSAGFQGTHHAMPPSPLFSSTETSDVANQSSNVGSAAIQTSDVANQSSSDGPVGFQTSRPSLEQVVCFFSSSNIYFNNDDKMCAWLNSDLEVIKGKIQNIEKVVQRIHHRH
uniref:Uncharacterized protein n=1 Tax=Ditylenchus dipsaci TaxID=166011 RepID=A0A915EEJ7_9BILA